jgi:hypothetical protein
MKIIVRDDIEQLRTPAGGFNQRTMEIIGVPWPLQEGWQQRIVGMRVSDRNWSAAQKAKAEVRHVFRGNTRRR